MKKNKIIDHLYREDKSCIRCGRDTPIVYVMTQGGIHCFTCHTRGKSERRELIASMVDVEDIPPLYPHFFICDALNVDSLWDSLPKYYWEN